MGGCGWHNPFPFQLGGDPTEIEKTYHVLRSAVGKGGACPDEDSIEALYRQSKAKGIGLVHMMDQRAMLQAFPDKATSLLGYYERTLRVPADPTAAQHERRATVASRWTVAAAFLLAEIELTLQAIDSRFELVVATVAEASTTLVGRNLEDLAATEPFNGGRKGTLYPNYSTHFVVTALLDLDGDLPTPSESRSIRQARAVLADVLPAWIGFQVVTHIGFRLDIDRLDLTTLSP